MARATASSSAVVPPPRWTRASACLLEMPTGPGKAPLLKPACSTSHAAGTFLRPSASAHDGTPGARCCRSANCSGVSRGLVKNDPTLRLSGSVGSTTIPLPLRSRRTASRTCASGAGAPSSTPRTRASSA